MYREILVDLFAVEWITRNRGDRRSLYYAALIGMPGSKRIEFQSWLDMDQQQKDRRYKLGDRLNRYYIYIQGSIHPSIQARANLNPLASA